MGAYTGGKSAEFSSRADKGKNHRIGELAGRGLPGGRTYLK